MELSKIITVISAFLLLVCLVTSVVSLTVMRNAVDECAALRKETQKTLSSLNGAVSALKDLREDAVAASADGEDVEADVLYDTFRMTEVGGKIGIYASDGELIRLLDIDVGTLPAADRQRLREGILTHSWREIAALIEDYS